MVEEGIAYAVKILELTQDRFRIRMRNPGEPVQLTLVPVAPCSGFERSTRDALIGDDAYAAVRRRGSCAAARSMPKRRQAACRRETS
jgi:hypothetical protein